MKPIALITGATSGIGEATARILAPKYRLIITGRRSERLDQVKNELDTEVITLNFDVRDREAVNQAIESLPAEWQEIDVLINNAGNAHGLAPIQDGSVDDWDAMIDINVKGLLYVSKAIIPGMVSRKKGHIINIGSIAGIEAYPNGNVYNASKFGVNAISQGMRLDLNPHNIKVSEIKPGLVQTEFSEVRFKGDKEKADKVYQGFDALQAVDIAETIEFILSRPAHVNIADMLVFPSAQASATMVNKKS
ncbi:SDR family NAD(P)-dependent oxidoreductase [Marinoscillum pacificum]|uniref:SDR family NAD(P)-dependent oxidoreductase n=1 Tax=Marinoscillum pacificum TaxID=392723 RepID=UPI0021575202|nr:SDR family NAD(P)-dependent oxidoreductase [Marinoscillum pacificum]